jgi:hypothetical protein
MNLTHPFERQFVEYIDKGFQTDEIIPTRRRSSIIIGAQSD